MEQFLPSFEDAVTNCVHKQQCLEEILSPCSYFNFKVNALLHEVPKVMIIQRVFLALTLLYRSFPSNPESWTKLSWDPGYGSEIRTPKWDREMNTVLLTIDYQRFICSSYYTAWALVPRTRWHTDLLLTQCPPHDESLDCVAHQDYKNQENSWQESMLRQRSALFVSPLVFPTVAYVNVCVDESGVNNNQNKLQGGNLSAHKHHLMMTNCQCWHESVLHRVVAGKYQRAAWFQRGVWGRRGVLFLCYVLILTLSTNSHQALHETTDSARPLLLHLISCLYFDCVSYFFPLCSFFSHSRYQKYSCCICGLMKDRIKWKYWCIIWGQ